MASSEKVFGLGKCGRKATRAVSKERLVGRVALVTGASSGIGRAIAVALAQNGARVCVVGRNRAALAETAAAAKEFSEVDEFRMDLTSEESVRTLARHLQDEAGRLDVLVHSAGVIQEAPMERSQLADLDLQYTTNVRAPYLLTQQLLPLLTSSHGQVVFINSSAGLSAKRPDIGQYAATKHALKAIADSLREEVNAKGVRVLSVHLGRTATPMQRAFCERQGISYKPELLLQPEDVASVVVHALMLPLTAEVTDVNMRPMQKSY